jgi:hypothetical protein
MGHGPKKRDTWTGLSAGRETGNTEMGDRETRRPGDGGETLETFWNVSGESRGCNRRGCGDSLAVLEDFQRGMRMAGKEM